MNENTQNNEHEEPIDDELSEEQIEVVAEEADEAAGFEEEAEDLEEETLESQLERALAQVDEFKAALQRERADFVNFRKRIEREKTEMRANSTANTVAQFLPILDDFDRALASTSQEMNDTEWLKGFSMIHKKFNDLLHQLGVEPIDPLGEPFDPNYHEAIGSEDSDEYDSGAVIHVLQKGYMLDSRCIRPAMVRVAN